MILFLRERYDCLELTVLDCFELEVQIDEGVGFLVVTAKLLLPQVLLRRFGRLEVEVADPRLLDHPRIVLLCGVLINLACVKLKVLWEFATQNHLDRASSAIGYHEGVKRILVDDL